VPAQRQDTAARAAFAKCIIKHIDEWFAFARECDLGISREDIILVTGRHLARSWANIAFHNGDEQVSFGVQVSGRSGVNWQFTPEGARGVMFNLGPSGQVRFVLHMFSTFDGILTKSESTRGSVLIRQGFPCHPFFEDIPMASRGRNAGSESS
jgi:hypothetical protein